MSDFKVTRWCDYRGCKDYYTETRDENNCFVEMSYRGSVTEEEFARHNWFCQGISIRYCPTHTKLMVEVFKSMESLFVQSK